MSKRKRNNGDTRALGGTNRPGTPTKYITVLKKSCSAGEIKTRGVQAEVINERETLLQTEASWSICDQEWGCSKFFGVDGN